MKNETADVTVISTEKNVELDTPIQRGNQLIESVVIRKPRRAHCEVLVYRH
jgi:hypothetical protein